MSETTPEPTKFQTYCTMLYAHMDSEAVDEDGDRIWRGRITAIARNLGIPTGTYGKVIKQLRMMGCIEQVVRGSRGIALSVFVLHYPPTAERFQDFGAGNLTGGPNLDRLAADVENLKRQIGGLNIVSALAEFEDRLGKIERQLQDNRGK